jgi:hypothetical protein
MNRQELLDLLCTGIQPESVQRQATTALYVRLFEEADKSARILEGAVRMAAGATQTAGEALDRAIRGLVGGLRLAG